MASVFHEAIEYALEKMGHPDLELKRQQYEAIRAICVEKKDVLAVLPTGFGKSLIYQVIPAVFDFLHGGREPQNEDSVVIVVSPLNALIKDQVQKLENCLHVCVLQSIVEEEEEQKITLPKNLKGGLVFGHPEVFVDNRSVSKMLKGKDMQKRVKGIVIDEAHLTLQWSTFRPAYGKIAFLTNLFPSVPVLALTGTATTATKSGIVESLGLSNPEIIECNPDRPNIYYASHIRPDRGEEKLKSILDPIVSELKASKKQMPLTIIYGNLETISECFLYFSENMGKDQYFPRNAEPLAKNRLFTQYHAQYPEHERTRIIEELVKGISTHRVLFVTIAFGMGIDCNDIRRIVHIGVPYTMEDYYQEVGRAGRDGLPARADIYFNSYDTSKSRKNMTDVMRNFVQANECKRKLILSYFDHKVPETIQGPCHTCCDFHSRQCACEDCQLTRVAEQVEATCVIGEDQAFHFSQDATLDEATPYFSTEVQEGIRMDLVKFRVGLQNELGRSTVGSVALSSGFSIELIDLALKNLKQLTSVEKVEEILPIYSHQIATELFSIIQKHTSKRIR